MFPAFKVHALGVLPLEQVVVKLVVGAVGAMTFQMRFAFGVQVGLVGINAAVRAV